jgi:UDP-N-acetylglucosamine/UDP-N-acetylgalactosamine diphosphorylase
MHSRIQKEKERIEKYGQEHLFRFWDELNNEEKHIFLSNLEKIDYDLVTKLYSDCLTSNIEEKENFNDMQRPDLVSRYPYTKEHAKAISVGETAICNNELGLFVVAGGQGSRLGFNGPKGLYPATPIMHKSLFQVFAEKILVAQKIYAVKLHWFIMTSSSNNIQTVDFFAKNNYFGLDKDNLHFFIQMGDLPAVDKNGKILMKSKYEVFFSPSGTGAIYSSLVESGMLNLMKLNNIKYLSYFNVDNSLINIVDPLYLGYHILHESELSMKVLTKRDATEPLGNMVKVNGKHKIIEYMNLPKTESERKTESGELFFKIGSIAIMMFSVDYIERMHYKKLINFNTAALKKVPFIDENGTLITPQMPNAYKFEAFVFDTMPHAHKSLAFEVMREEEFAPIKNATGEDSPEVAYKMQSDLFKKWLIYAGISSDIVDKLKNVEISPLFAIDKDTFKEKISKDLTYYSEKLNNVHEFYFE